MSAAYDKLFVIVPTRNRATLAMNAIQSVFSQDNDSVRVLVSDNSTVPDESAALSQFCKQLQHERLHRVVPEEPLPMVKHWNFAIKRALQMGASHITVLTDRMMFKAGELDLLLRVVERHPSKIISYRHDRIIDHQQPVRLFLNEWTGKLWEINSAQLLYLTSQSLLHESLPRMLNCIVPRSILNGTEKTFGNIFDSLAPDLSFCYRALALEDSILYYDKAPIIMWAQNRSVGHTEARGITNSDHSDFFANVTQEELYCSAPIPELRTVLNSIIHHYCFVKQESGNPKFVEVDKDRYLRFVAKDLEDFEDEDSKKEMEKILLTRGWTPPRRNKMEPSVIKKLLTPAVLAQKLRLTMGSAPTKRFWLSLEKHFAILPPEINGFEFGSSQEALDYARKFPRRSRASLPEQESLLKAAEIFI